jgi:hypothetical protein
MEPSDISHTYDSAYVLKLSKATANGAHPRAPPANSNVGVGAKMVNVVLVTEEQNPLSASKWMSYVPQLP